MLQKIKDKALSHGAKIAINKQIESYGKVQSLHLDSRTKYIDMEIMLNGEPESLKVHIDKYELIETDGRHQLKVNRVTTSHSWINTLTFTYLEGKAIDVPDEYAKMLNAVI